MDFSNPEMKNFFGKITNIVSKCKYFVVFDVFVGFDVFFICRSCCFCMLHVIFETKKLWQTPRRKMIYNLSLGGELHNNLSLSLLSALATAKVSGSGFRTFCAHTAFGL